jgi:hypothetical protein
VPLVKPTRWYLSPLITEPSTERQPGNTLETVPNDLDEATHNDLDKKILVNNPKSNLETYATTNIFDGLLERLLLFIVSNSEGKLDPKYASIDAAQELLHNHLELKGELKNAWMEGKFKRIRNLSAFSIANA